LHQEGLEAIDAGRYEEGLAKLEQSVVSNPRNTTYRLDLKARREAVVQRLNGIGDTLRRTGQLDDAESAFQRVLAIEPSNNRARRGIDGVHADQRHAELLAQAQKDLERGATEQADAKVRAILAEDPGFAPALSLRGKIDQARGPVTVVRTLRSRDNRPVTLQFRDANTKMIFEVLSRQTGINFLFDKDVRSDSKTTIYVQEVPVEQAIELVLGQNQLARQVLSENMALIYPNTAAKQKEYADQIVKAFYLTNADTKQAQNLLKTVLNAKTLFIDERANVIIIRDTPETVRMAEKLLASLDLPEPEVMMEVEVLEITRSSLQQLGINYPASVTFAATPPEGGDQLVLSDIHKQNADTITVSPLSVTLDMLKQTGVSNILASPRIRARSKEKAKILIGSRVPVITNSVTPISGGTSVVTGSVQYVDVGLTLEVEPNVYLDNDVSIKVRLEVSNIIKEVRDPVSGTLAYQIGTRDANTLLRLKDGETQILAGLIQDLDTRSSSHIPGLGDIPGAGYLFGSKRATKEKTEIVLSITPRIIRSQPRPASEITEFWYGTEASARSAPLGVAAAGGTSGSSTSASATPVTAPGATEGPDAVELSIPGAADVPANGTTTTTTTYAPASAPALAPAPVTMAAPPTSTAQRSAYATGGVPAIEWNAPGQVAVGQDFDVTLRFADGEAMKSLRSQIRYDPAVLLLESADAGDVIPGSIRPVTVPRINQIAGVVQFVATASTEEPVQGNGDLLVLHFKALKPNPATKISLQLAAIAASGGNIPAAQQPPLTIVVMP
jgi:general secretion pathway protein D